MIADLEGGEVRGRARDARERGEAHEHVAVLLRLFEADDSIGEPLRDALLELASLADVERDAAVRVEDEQVEVHGEHRDRDGKELRVCHGQHALGLRERLEALEVRLARGAVDAEELDDAKRGVEAVLARALPRALPSGAGRDAERRGCVCARVHHAHRKHVAGIDGAERLCLELLAVLVVLHKHGARALVRDEQDARCNVPADDADAGVVVAAAALKLDLRRAC